MIPLTSSKYFIPIILDASSWVFVATIHYPHSVRLRVTMFVVSISRWVALARHQQHISFQPAQRAWVIFNLCVPRSISRTVKHLKMNPGTKSSNTICKTLILYNNRCSPHGKQGSNFVLTYFSRLCMWCSTHETSCMWIHRSVAIAHIRYKSLFKSHV